MEQSDLERMSSLISEYKGSKPRTLMTSSGEVTEEDAIGAIGTLLRYLEGASPQLRDRLLHGEPPPG